jgi:hypothetical protein
MLSYSILAAGLMSFFWAFAEPRRHFVHTPMADFDRSAGRGWATVPPEVSLPPAGADQAACKTQGKADPQDVVLEGNVDVRAGVLGQFQDDSCSALDRESRAFEGEVTCSTMDFSRIRKGVQLTCGSGGYGHSVDRIVYVSGHVQVAANLSSLGSRVQGPGFRIT